MYRRTVTAVRSWPMDPFPSWESGHSHCLVRAGIRSPEQRAPDPLLPLPQPLQAACLHAAALCSVGRWLTSSGGLVPAGSTWSRRQGPGHAGRSNAAVFRPACSPAGGQDRAAGGQTGLGLTQLSVWTDTQRGQDSSRALWEDAAGPARVEGARFSTS